MNFIDFEFWPTLIVGLGLIGLLRLIVLRKIPQAIGGFDKSSLAILSLVLLAGVNVLTFSIFLTLAGLSYVGIQIVARLPMGKRKAFLWVFIPLLFIPLFYYKYRSFALEQILGWEQVTLQAIAIPAGISFYTFQMVAILVDGARLSDYRPRAIDFLNFTSFFPQVVAGPIERKDDLMPQVQSFRWKFSLENLDKGAPWIALGFFYKVCLADNLSPFIDRDAMDSAWPILWNTFLFGLKIYFDFCGYSLIALGLGKFLGINLTLNFRSPYYSTNIRDFWRRWHVSLSFWFRDYVYIPLGGSKTALWPLSLMTVFLVSGIWHGAGWGFVLWGGLHGLYCVISHGFKGKLSLPAPLGWLITMILVFLAWLPFFETRWDVLAQKVKILCMPRFYGLIELKSFVNSFGTAEVATMLAAVALCVGTLCLEGISSKRGNFYSFAQNRYATALFIALTVFLGSSQGNSFVYFSF